MNLKESFRYQKFLDNLISSATCSIVDRGHCMTTVKTHLISQANPDGEDKVETVEVDPFVPNDDMIRFLRFLVSEKEKLSQKIGETKSYGFLDIDAAIETNKARQKVAHAIKNMLRNTPSKRTERGQGWKFSNEGVQSPYYYDVEVVTSEAFDRDSAKAVVREELQKADEISAKIDDILINSTVAYEPPFDVNDSFEDVVAEFLAK